MTDAEFDNEVSEVLDDADEMIRAITSVKYWTPDQLDRLQQGLRECTAAMDQLLQVEDYVNQMHSEAGKLTPRQIKAIEVLMSEPGVEAAARAAGVHRMTLFRWLNDPTFSKVYRDARARLLERTLVILQSASADAVNVLVTVMNNTDAADQTRVTAAGKIIEFCIKAREHLEFEDRLRQLELSTVNQNDFRRQAFQA